ncbi:MAG: Rrf2 family transcriptional regulator [candidate division Zixibacteria bacterium]
MFSAKAHYGLKAVIYLAKMAGKGPVQAKEIASSQNVPVRYLELLLSQLKKARIINSNRGKLGGYFLGEQASSIKVYDIIIALEGQISFISSHEIKENDPIEMVVADYWNSAQDLLIRSLQQTGIEELLQKADSDEQMYYI